MLLPEGSDQRGLDLMLRRRWPLQFAAPPFLYFAFQLREVDAGWPKVGCPGT